MADKKCFSLLDAAGNVVMVHAGLGDVTASAARLGLQVMGDPAQLASGDGPVRNGPVDAPDGGWTALRRCGLHGALRAQGVVLGAYPTPQMRVPIGRDPSIGKAVPFVYHGGDTWYGLNYAKVCALSVQEAHAKLRPWLPAKKVWNTPASTVDRILVQNAKTSKVLAGGTHFSRAVGLTLMPHQLPFRVGHGEGPSPTGYRYADFSPEHAFDLQSPAFERLHNPHDPDDVLDKYSFCVGSSQQCRAGCLVYAGQNPATDESFQAKLSLSYALLHEPLAFGRLLLEACRKEFAKGPTLSAADLTDAAEVRLPYYWKAAVHEPGHAFYDASLLALVRLGNKKTPAQKARLKAARAACKEGVRQIIAEEERQMAAAQRAAGAAEVITVRRWVRLNVLSDLPWELIFPDLLSDKPAPDTGTTLRPSWGGFYDYTKVGARRPGPNYDLTLSYAGDNRGACMAHLAQGGKVAAVFVRAVDPRQKQRQKAGVKESYTSRYAYAATGREVGQREYAKRGVGLIPFGQGQIAALFGKDYPVVNGDSTDIRAEDRGQFGLPSGGYLVHLSFKPSQSMFYAIDPATGARKRHLRIAFDIDAAKKVSFVVACRQVPGTDLLLVDGGVTGAQALSPAAANQLATVPALNLEEQGELDEELALLDLELDEAGP